MTDRETLIDLLCDELEDCPRVNNVADHLIANCVAFATDKNDGHKWIPVTERLPEPETDVLAYSHGCVVIMTYRYTRHGYLYFMDFDESGYWHEKYGVTHWMPLPDPPKEVAK